MGARAQSPFATGSVGSGGWLGTGRIARPRLESRGPRKQTLLKRQADSKVLSLYLVFSAGLQILIEMVASRTEYNPALDGSP